jgi:hypothetical protein
VECSAKDNTRIDDIFSILVKNIKQNILSNGEANTDSQALSTKDKNRKKKCC